MVIALKDHRGREIAISFYRNPVGSLRGTLTIITGEQCLLSTRFGIPSQDAAVLISQLGGTVAHPAEGPDYCDGCGHPVGVSGCGCDKE